MINFKVLSWDNTLQNTLKNTLKIHAKINVFILFSIPEVEKEFKTDYFGC